MCRRLLCHDIQTFLHIFCLILLFKNASLCSEDIQMLFIFLRFQPFIKLFPLIRDLRLLILFRILKRIILRVIIHFRSRHTRIFRIIDRDFRAPLSIEINGGNFVENSNGFLYSRGKYLPNSLFIFKFDFSLRWMDIHINVLSRHFKIDEIRHLFTHRYQSVKSRQHSLIEIRMLHIAPIGKEILMNTLFAGRLRFTYETADFAHCGIHIHRKQILIKTFAEYIDDTLTQSASLEIEHLCAIAVQSE